MKMTIMNILLTMIVAWAFMILIGVTHGWMNVIPTVGYYDAVVTIALVRLIWWLIKLTHVLIVND